MTTKTVYCVQTFRGTPKRLEMGALSQHNACAEALARADEMKGRAAGCLVFVVQGDAAVGWGEPAVVASFGLVPPLAA